MLPTRTITLTCKVEHDVIGQYTTNCPIDQLAIISGIVQDANINLSNGNEVNTFETTVRALGYTIEEVASFSIEI